MSEVDEVMRENRFNRRRVLVGAAGLSGALFSISGLGRGARPALAGQEATPGTAGCAQGGGLAIGQDFGPQSLDPTTTIAWASTNVEELIYSGLLRWSPEMEIEPDLALSYEVAPDGLTYTFRLREGVTFHNGASFSSQDVKYTFDRIRDPATASPHLAVYADVAAVEAPDPTTVVIRLSKPFAPLLRYLATIPYGGIIPDGGGEEIATQPVGTGPFAFDEYLLDQEVRLRRFDDYYVEGLPYFDEVVFRLLADDPSIAAALQSGTVQLGWLKNPLVAENVAKAAPDLRSVPGVSSRYIPIFFDVASPPFDDVRVRRAMSLALDRKTIVETVLGGFGSVGTFLPPSQLAGYVGDGSDLPYYTQDVEGARQLLDEAGIETLTVPEFKVVAANQLDVQAAQLMKEQWAAAGIEVTINPMEVGAILEDWQSGNFQMAMVGTVWSPDPNQEVEPFDSRASFGQGIGIADPEIDALIDQAKAEVDPERRVELYRQIEQRVLDQVYVIVPYTYPLRWELVNDSLAGYQVMPSNARLTLRATCLTGG